MSTKRAPFAKRLLRGLKEVMEYAEGKRKLRVIKRTVSSQPKAGKQTPQRGS